MYKVDIISCVSDPFLIEEEVFNLWIGGIPGKTVFPTNSPNVNKLHKCNAHYQASLRTIVTNLLYIFNY